MCHCSHLTNFAILMQVVPLEVREGMGAPGPPRVLPISLRGAIRLRGWAGAAGRADPVVRDICEALLLCQTRLCLGAILVPCADPGPLKEPLQTGSWAQSIFCLRSRAGCPPCVGAVGHVQSSGMSTLAVTGVCDCPEKVSPG